LKKAALRAIGLLAVITCAPTLAVDQVPETSGFSGFFLVAPAYFNVESNLLVEGPPLIGDVGNTRIDSIFGAPATQSSPGLVAGGEVNYTFSGTRTQLFFGNRLEDFLRLDLTFGLGVRQELPGDSILAFSVLLTPAQMKVWSDPYVEGEDRVATERNKPGVRLRWGRIFGTGLELTVTLRDFRHDDERSGDWLIEEGRLDPALQPLLDRNGDSRVYQLLYRINSGQRHVFEPMLRYVDHDLDGAAMAVSGPVAQLTYLYLSPKLVVDVNLIYGQQDASTVHPVYRRTLDADRMGVAVTAFYKLFKKTRWRAFASLDYLREDANIDFFDHRISGGTLGVIWRHARK
jgi:hypothetical protein